MLVQRDVEVLGVLDNERAVRSEDVVVVCGSADREGHILLGIINWGTMSVRESIKQDTRILPLKNQHVSVFHHTTKPDAEPHVIVYCYIHPNTGIIWLIVDAECLSFLSCDESYWSWRCIC